ALPNGRHSGKYSRPVAAFSAQDHMAGVKRVQEYIAAGDVYQLVLSVRFGGRHDLHPFEVYRALRFINPSPYMYYCALGDVTVVGSSPSWSRLLAACTAARSGTSASAATWIRLLRSARSCSAAMNTVTRPAAESSPTACPRPNTRRCSRRAPPPCARFSSQRKACE